MLSNKLKNAHSNAGHVYTVDASDRLRCDKAIVFITGITGMLGRTLTQKYADTHLVVGVARCVVPVASALVIECDINSPELEEIICSVQPNLLVHLGSISNVEESEKYPYDTIQTNALSTYRICQTIIKHKIDCKMFHPSSSDMYKGHASYCVQEDDTHFYPNSTYGLSKVMSHQFVQYFRNNHNLHASNGIIFTTECKYRNKLFLLQKCAQHAKGWHKTQEPLHLGNLQSHRVLTHADDVANGIQFILQQPCAADYIVCGDDKYCVEDVVVQLYAKANIYLQKTKDGFVDKLTNQIVLQVGECMRHTNTDIYANVQKLKALGWSAKKTLDDILSEYIRDT